MEKARRITRSQLPDIGDGRARGAGGVRGGLGALGAEAASPPGAAAREIVGDDGGGGKVAKAGKIAEIGQGLRSRLARGPGRGNSTVEGEKLGQAVLAPARDEGRDEAPEVLAHREAALGHPGAHE